MIREKCLIINRGVNTDNIGDESIAYCLENIIINFGFNVEKKDLNSIFFRVNKNKPYVLLKNIYNLSKYIRNNCIKYVFIGGGQLILGNKRFPYSMYVWVILLKIFSDSKIFITSIGCSKKQNSISLYTYKLIFRLVDNVYARDEQSKKNIFELFNFESKIVPDVSFMISDFLPKQHNSYRKGMLVGITAYDSIKNYDFLQLNHEDYLNSYVKLIQKYQIKNNIDQVTLIYNTKKDLCEAQKLKIKLGKDIKIKEYFSLKDYCEIINKSELVLSGRMHALIISLSYGIDVIPYVRNEKLRGFQEYINLNNIDDIKSKINNGYKNMISERYGEIL